MRTVANIEDAGAPSAAQLEILAIVAYFGQATRTHIERYLGED